MKDNVVKNNKSKNFNEIMDYSATFIKIKSVISYFLYEYLLTSSAELKANNYIMYGYKESDITTEVNNPELIFRMFSFLLTNFSESFIKDLDEHLTELGNNSNFTPLNQFSKRFIFRNAYFFYKFLLNNREKIDNFTILQEYLELHVKNLKERFLVIYPHVTNIPELQLILILAENIIFARYFLKNLHTDKTYRPEVSRGLEFITFLFGIPFPLQLSSEAHFKELVIEPSPDFVTGYKLKERFTEPVNRNSQEKNLINQMLKEMNTYQSELRQLVHSLLFGDICDAYRKDSDEYHFALTTGAIINISKEKYESLKNLYGFVCPICHNFIDQTDSTLGWLEGIPTLNFIFDMRIIFNVNMEIEILGLKTDHKIIIEYLESEYRTLTAYDLLLRLPKKTILSLNEKIDILVNNSRKLTIYDKFSDHFDFVSTITILNQQQAFETDIKAHVKGVEGYYEQFKKELDDDFN